MAAKKTKPRHTFRRHVAPFAPVALAAASMISGNTGTKPSTSTPTAAVQHGAGTFNPVCSLPFPGVRNSSSDDHCGIQGGSSDTAKQLESRSKNDFCEKTDSPEAVSHDDLLALQTKATAANLKKSLPDRKVVEDMGEGKYVSYVAFIKDAHYSDTNAGEAVNCNIPGNDTNDIHIVLMADDKDTDECHSTTAEMSPHFRPPSWTPDNIMKASAGHPVRLRGHLFYDGSHTPCHGTARPNPKRASLWEIHPVYSFEVCSQTTLAECQAASAEWTPLEKMFSTEDSE